jgi:hypothetical protein
MTKIVNNPDLAESLGQNGRKIASSELNVSDFNEKIVKFIDEVLRN